MCKSFPKSDSKIIDPLLFLTNPVLLLSASIFLLIAITGCAKQASTLPSTFNTSPSNNVENNSTACSLLPDDNILKARVDSLPVDPQSDLLIQDANVNASLHADFGSDAAYGIPVNMADPTTPSRPVVFQIPSESDPGPYVEGSTIEQGSDHHLITISPTCKLYETFSTTLNADGSLSAYSGAIFDLTSDNLRPDTWTSADAAGLPMAPLLVRYDEVATGTINHALRFTTNRTQAAHVWPARHDAGLSYNALTPLLPMGAVIRLKGNVDISSFSPTNQVILAAMKQYGMILADNGSQLYFSGSSDPRWNDDDLSQLGKLTFNDFEVASRTARAAQMININSGQAR